MGGILADTSYTSSNMFDMLNIIRVQLKTHKKSDYRMTGRSRQPIRRETERERA